MFHESWWHQIANSLGCRLAGRKASNHSRRHLEVELLEDRLVPANIFVHNVNDGIVSGLTPLGGGNFLANNLRSAVADSTALGGSNTVYLDTATYLLTAQDGGELQVSYGVKAGLKSLTITNRLGGISTINAQNQSRIFEVDGGGVTTLDHLQLMNGTEPSSSTDDTIGGAILNEGNLTLTYDNINHNTATSYGGNDTSFAGRGGGIFNAESAILTMKYSTVDSNTAEGTFLADDSTSGGDASGGGLCVGTLSGLVTIIGCTFSNNTAMAGNNSEQGGEAVGGEAFGGGLQIVDTIATVKVINSTFVNNTATGGSGYGGGGNAYGGGIMANNQNTLDLVNDTIAINHVTGGSSTGNGTGTGYGGGVATFGGDNTVKPVNTIIADNTADMSNDVYGDFSSLGHNLVTDISGADGFTAAGDLTNAAAVPDGLNAANGGLQQNGGPTQTTALFAFSMAINAGNNAVATNSALLNSLGIAPLAYDQRGPGFSRKVDNTVDIGAFEFQMNLNKGYSLHSNTTHAVTFTVPAPGLLLGSANFPLPEGEFYQIVLVGTPPGGGTTLVINSDGSFTFNLPARYRNTVKFQFRLLVNTGEGTNSTNLRLRPDDGDETVISTNLIFTATIQVASNGGRGSAGAFLGL